jgi:hypothetical protein
MSDEAVRRRTGRDWKEWLALLDAEGAASMPHKEIALLLYERYDLDGWWAQMVTVGYERLRGRRATNQTCDGDFQANASRTFPVPVSRLFEAWNDPAIRAKWLGEAVVVRTATKNRSMRITWSDGTGSVEPWFTAKGPRKSSVGVQHRKLSSPAEVARARAFWTAALARLHALLTRPRA